MFMMTNSDRTTTSLEFKVSECVADALAPGEIVLGVLTDFDSHGRPLVKFPQCQDPNGYPAITTVTAVRADIGRQVALLFANGDVTQPIMLGLIYSPLYQLLDTYMASTTSASSSDSDVEVFEEASLTQVAKPDAIPLAADSVRVDGKRVVIEGEEEVVLMCGESSISLKRNGKITIRGKYLLSRASGVNRILGGSVEVN